jgi:hypothetical protein
MFFRKYLGREILILGKRFFFDQPLEGKDLVLVGKRNIFNFNFLFWCLLTKNQINK